MLVRNMELKLVRDVAGAPYVMKDWEYGAYGYKGYARVAESLKKVNGFNG